jgi:CRISPR system Cascade subunit CasE
MSQQLFLVRLVLDRRLVLRVGVRHRLGHAADEGALLHAALSQLFARSRDARAEIPLHCFAVDDTRAAAAAHDGRLFLLAYAEEPGDQLVASMGPDRSDLLLECESRPMPDLASGQVLGFRTRVCPVVRTRRPGPGDTAPEPGGSPRYRELDAYVHATTSPEGGQQLSRESVYLNWLADQLARLGDAEFINGRLAEFRREVMRRRPAAQIERPNAVLEGRLSVGDPATFREMLARGIGRHRAFGFGMLLLRAAGVSWRG